MFISVWLICAAVAVVVVSAVQGFYGIKNGLDARRKIKAWSEQVEQCDRLAKALDKQSLEDAMAREAWEKQRHHYQYEFIPQVMKERDQWAQMYQRAVAGYSNGQANLAQALEESWRLMKRPIPADFQAILDQASGLDVELKKKAAQPLVQPTNEALPKLAVPEAPAVEPKEQKA